MKVTNLGTSEAFLVRIFAFACGLISTVCLAQQPRAAGDSSSETAPIRRVVLYKSGVGYFEHLGRVRDRQDLTIAFTPGQLNDVLKSLTVLDLNGGRVTGISYGSAAPVEKQLGDLRLSVGEKTTLTEFLGALRGARVEVRSGPSSIVGRLLSVERKTRMGSGATLEVDYVSVVTDGGEVRTTELGPGFAVRLLDRGLGGKVDRYLDLVASSRDTRLRRMNIATSGTGERDLFISYVSEVPIWKSTYRLVYGGKDGSSATLQGWAIVDNTIGQDWSNVQLSLVAGAPQSFVQNLSQPYYGQRPVIPPPALAMTVPQTFESTLVPGGTAKVAGTIRDPAGAVVVNVSVRAIDSAGEVVSQTTTDANGAYEFSSLPEGAVRLQAEYPGFRRTTTEAMMASALSPVKRDLQLQVGDMGETVQVMAESAQLNASSARASSRNVGSGMALGGNRTGSGGGFQPGSGGNFGGGVLRFSAPSPPPAVTNVAIGDLFEYKIKEPITIPKNQSAMVPIVQAPVKAEKVSVWNDSSASRVPQRALWISNSTGATLDGGSFTVIEEDAFAGEGLFDTIQRDEKRLVSFASDIALHASSQDTREHHRATRLVVSRGVLAYTTELREKKTYTFRNEDSHPRTVIVEHPVRTGYELRSASKPIETTARWMRFSLQVGPKESKSLEVEEAHPIATNYSLSNVTADQITLFTSQRMPDKRLETALRDILDRRAAVRALEKEKAELESSSQGIFDDQERLRENLKALKGSAEEKALVQRYTSQLNEQENRLEAFRKQKSAVEAREAAAKAELQRVIEGLVFEINL